MVSKYIRKDHHKRQLVFRKELAMQCLRSAYFNVRLPQPVRRMAYLLLSRERRAHPMTQLKNRCVVTGRARGVYRFFKLARFQLNAGVVTKVFPYVQKSSW